MLHPWSCVLCRARLQRVKEMIKMHDDYRAYYFIPAVDERIEDQAREFEAHSKHREIGSR